MNKRIYTYFIFFAIVLTFVIGWFIEIVNGKIPVVDLKMQQVALTYNDTFVYTFFRWMTELGSEHFVIPFVIVMMFVIGFILRDWLPAVTFGLGVLSAHILNLVIKNFVERDRPSISVVLNAEGFSYPSGHAMVSIVCYGLLAFFITKKLTSMKAKFITQFLFALLVFLVGMSRPMLNVHYLTDVITGFVLGYLCFIGIISLYEYLQRKRRDHQSEKVA